MVRAVLALGRSQLEVGEVSRPEGPVLVRPEMVGICGTDVKVLSGAIPVDYPLVMGHELVGRVAAAAHGWGEGDRVLVDPAIACGTCDLCRKGRLNLCRRGGLMGRDSPGVFSDLVAVDHRRLIAVPDSVPERAAGLLQVLGTCVHAQRSVDVFPGDVAAVVGLGVAGQLMVQLLADRGATVVGITRSEWKRALAAEHGAVAVSPPETAGEVLDDLTGGRGPDLVVEAAGTEGTLGLAIELVGVGGEVLVFGTITSGDQGLPYYQLYFKELTLYNPRAALPDDYVRAVELVAQGLIQPGPLVTHVLPLEEAAQAFNLVKDPSSLKVLMTV